MTFRVEFQDNDSAAVVENVTDWGIIGDALESSYCFFNANGDIVASFDSNKVAYVEEFHD